jgi:hypothetical protein
MPRITFEFMVEKGEEKDAGFVLQEAMLQYYKSHKDTEEDAKKKHPNQFKEIQNAAEEIFRKRNRIALKIATARLVDGGK